MHPSQVVQYVRLIEIEGGKASARVFLQQVRPVAFVIGVPAASAERLAFSGHLSIITDRAGILSLPISWANARVAPDPVISRGVIGLVLEFPSAENRATLGAIFAAREYTLKAVFSSWPPRGSSLWVSGFEESDSQDFVRQPSGVSRDAAGFRLNTEPRHAMPDVTGFL